jgi:pyruvate/2-oxoglutarate dehydrogenase complex dihydrolipoamide acyltransferase (E2) component
VLFIIESMKLMNEVTSEYDGTVREIFAQNGGVVEYGQAVMAIHNSYFTIHNYWGLLWLYWIRTR